MILVFLVAIWLSKVAEAQQTSGGSARDPIIGIWIMDTSRGEKYEYVLTVRPDGTVKNRLMHEEFEGTWKRAKSGHYIMEPAGEDDYVVVRHGRLEEWDKTGFIRSFHRVKADGVSDNNIDLAREAKLKRDARGWIYARFTPGMWWKASTIKKFEEHAGPYIVSKAQAPYHRAFYFSQADITILVDDGRGVAMTLRDGRKTR